MLRFLLFGVFSAVFWSKVGVSLNLNLKFRLDLDLPLAIISTILLICKIKVGYNNIGVWDQCIHGIGTAR